MLSILCIILFFNVIVCLIRKSLIKWHKACGSQPSMSIMTRVQTTVQSYTEELGGTAHVMSVTSTEPTSEGHTRRLLTGSSGITGRDINILYNSQKWRFQRSTNQIATSPFSLFVLNQHSNLCFRLRRLNQKRSPLHQIISIILMIHQHS